MLEIKYQKTRDVVYKCLYANVLLLIFVAIVVLSQVDASSKYFRFGPASDFYVSGVLIDTNIKYIFLLCVILVMKIVKTVVNSFSSSKLFFRIYNENVHDLYCFGKTELELIYFILGLSSGLRSVIEFLISVTQIDIAVFSVIVAEVSSLVIVRVLLKDKIEHYHSQAQHEHEHENKDMFEKKKLVKSNVLYSRCSS